MRRLQTQDVFKALRIITATGLKEDLKEIVQENEGNETITKDVGVDIIFKILERVSGEKTEQAVYDFLSGPFEVTAEAVREMPVTDLMENIRKIEDVGSWKTFFRSVSALMTK